MSRPLIRTEAPNVGSIRATGLITITPVRGCRAGSEYDGILIETHAYCRIKQQSMGGFPALSLTAISTRRSDALNAVKNRSTIGFTEKQLKMFPGLGT